MRPSTPDTSYSRDTATSAVQNTYATTSTTRFPTSDSIARERSRLLEPVCRRPHTSVSRPMLQAAPGCRSGAVLRHADPRSRPSATPPTPSLATADDVRGGVWDRPQMCSGKLSQTRKRERRTGFEPATPSLGSWPLAPERHHGVLAVPLARHRDRSRGLPDAPSSTFGMTFDDGVRRRGLGHSTQCPPARLSMSRQTPRAPLPVRPSPSCHTERPAHGGTSCVAAPSCWPAGARRRAVAAPPGGSA
jgi:hypothetical protein